jgi:sugar (pentulose or hexulose) kinase
MEAVAMALRDHMTSLFEPLDGPPKEVRSAGGGARSDLWLQIKADVLGTTVRSTLCPEPTSLGAAILAEAALTGAEVEQVADAWVRLRPPCLPDHGNRALYAEMA